MFLTLLSSVFFSSPLSTLTSPAPLTCPWGESPSPCPPLWLGAGTDQLSQAQLALQTGARLYQQGTATALQETITHWQQARHLYQEAGNQLLATTLLTNIGKVYTELGNYQQALELYQQALPQLQALNHPHAEAATRIAIAQVQTQFGEFQTALDLYTQTIPLWQQANYRTGIAETYNNMGLIYARLNDPQQALYYYSQALEIVRTLGNGAGEATTLNNMANTYVDTAQYEQAINTYQQALAIWETLGNLRGKASTLNNIGFAYASQGVNNPSLLPLARQAYDQALSLWQTLGDPQGEASTLNNLGVIDATQGNFISALTWYRQALPLRQQTGDRLKEALTLYRIAEAETELGNLETALSQIEQAITIIEELRTQVISQELRASFFASKQDYYELYIEILMQLHQQRPTAGFNARAFEVSEQARARSLLETLAETTQKIHQGIDPQLLEAKRNLEQQLDAVEQRRIKIYSTNHTIEQANAIKAEIEAILREYRALKVEIRQRSPRYANFTQPQPFTLSKIQQQVLDQETLLLSYFLGKKRSYLWAVTPTNLETYELANRQEITRSVQQFRDALVLPRFRFRLQQARQTSLSLSDLILAPVAGELQQKRLLIIADGALQYIPFNGLTVPGKTADAESWQPLIINHEIVMAPSASTVGMLRQELGGRPPNPKKLAVLADPVFGLSDERLTGTPIATTPKLPPELVQSAREAEVYFNRLPFTQQEAQEILALVPETARKQAFAFSASREAALNPELSQYQIVHFATHGLLNSVTPELSGLVLSLVKENGDSQNGFLRLHDIFNLQLPAALVVLSACQTGLGPEVRGEGLIGLTRGFMYAGAARVVVSLWSVDDQATAELMVKFYQGMLTEGLEPANALRTAQVQMWQKQQWQAPFYWAAFTMQGEWR